MKRNVMMTHLLVDHINTGTLTKMDGFLVEQLVTSLLQLISTIQLRNQKYSLNRLKENFFTFSALYEKLFWIHLHSKWIKNWVDQKIAPPGIGTVTSRWVTFQLENSEMARNSKRNGIRIIERFICYWHWSSMTFWAISRFPPRYSTVVGLSNLSR